MAVMKNALIVASLLASYTLAVPLASVNKRDMVWQTYTETVWVTQDQQATVWVDGHGKPVRTDMPSWWGAPSAQPAVASSSPSAAAAAPPASSAPAAAAAVAPSSSSAPAPTYSPAGFVTVASPSPSPVTPSSAPAAAAVAPAPSSSAVAQSSGGGGVCQGPDSGCVGDITHWDGGLGACGWNVDTSSDMQIAMPVGLMGSQSNGNPYCGKSLTIVGPTGNKVQATVGDKCMGCTGDSIDLTDVLFTAVAPSGDGRVHNIQWYFN